MLISTRLEPLPLYFIIRSRLWICIFIIINHSTYTEDHCLYDEYSLIKNKEIKKLTMGFGKHLCLVFSNYKERGNKGTNSP